VAGQQLDEELDAAMDVVRRRLHGKNFAVRAAQPFIKVCTMEYSR